MQGILRSVYEAGEVSHFLELLLQAIEGPDVNGLVYVVQNFNPNGWLCG